MTDNSTRIHRNKIKKTQHGNTPLRQTAQTLAHLGTGRGYHALVLHGGLHDERRPTKGSRSGTREKTRINDTWGPPKDRRENGQPEFEGTCVISRQPAFSVPFESSDHHETMRWLVATKRFLMVRIPLGNRSKTTIVMVIHAHPGRSKEANQQNQQIFDRVSGLAAGMGNSPLMICGDLQHEPRKQSRHLDVALSQGWPTDLGESQKLPGTEQAPAHVRARRDQKNASGFCTRQRSILFRCERFMKWCSETWYPNPRV